MAQRLSGKVLSVLWVAVTVTTVTISGLQWDSIAMYSVQKLMMCAVRQWQRKVEEASSCL